MICVIRIKGQVGITHAVKETLHRLRLRRKYACIILNPTKENLGMLERVKNFVAYGKLDDATYKELVEKRGKKDVDGKLKPFFRLHPPRKGIQSKVHYPKGVLGDHGDKINELVKRML
jgi:large subunit ribosomal protein L30